jgi:hypothetical protein
VPLLLKDNRTVLFVHVPKTAGTSIYRWFEKNGWSRRDYDQDPVSNRIRRVPPQHFHAEILRTIYRVGRFDAILQVSRHPVSRLISEFQYRMRNRRYPLSVPRFARWWDDKKQLYFQDPSESDNHLRPQHDFLLPGAKVLRLEDQLNGSALRRLVEDIGVAAENFDLPIKNVSPKLDFKISRKTHGDIEEFYQIDFKTFGYEP